MIKKPEVRRRYRGTLCIIELKFDGDIVEHSV